MVNIAIRAVRQDKIFSPKPLIVLSCGAVIEITCIAFSSYYIFLQSSNHLVQAFLISSMTKNYNN
jgi:hypothetical protein